jgi:very-short-patch-repair endonuclease
MSVAEADLMHLIKRSSLPTPLYNPRLYVHGDFLAKPDTWWEDAGVVAEVDSRQWHLSPEAWEQTMRRHDQMGAAGITVLHFSPNQIRNEPGFVVRTIQGALEAGRPLPWIKTEP